MNKLLPLSALSGVTAKASAAPSAPLLIPMPLLADASVGQAFGYILGLITAIAFIMGVISIVSGARAINRGEEGKLQIVGGILTALAIPIMRFIYTQLLPSAGVQNIQIQGF